MEEIEKSDWWEDGQWVPTHDGGKIWVGNYKWWYIKRLVPRGFPYSGTYTDLKYVDVAPSTMYAR